MKLSRRHFLKTSLGAAAFAGVAGGTVVLAASDELDVNPVELTLPRLPSAFDGLKIAQLSDIHMGSGMTEDRLLEIVQIVNAQQPDLVAITGDLVTMGEVADVADALIRPLRTLTPAIETLAVLGNHDHHLNAGEMSVVLRESGIHELPNDVMTLTRGGEQLYIAGVDDAWYGHDRLDLVLEKLPEEGGALLLMHEPDFADESAPTGRFDLQLSGHSHGGQVVMPLTGPVVLPRLGRKYHTGLYQVGNMLQYTNRGVGTVGPSLRLNCPPEVTVFTLRAPA